MKRSIVSVAISLFVLAFLLLTFSACNKTTPDDRHGGFGDYTVAYTAAPGGSLLGTTFKVVYKGDDGDNVTAVPDFGFRFLKWSDGIVTATRAEKNIQSNFSAIAYFTRLKYHEINYIGDVGIVYSVVKLMIYLSCFERIGMEKDIATGLLSNAFC